jgi:hypothetical protein
MTLIKSNFKSLPSVVPQNDTFIQGSLKLCSKNIQAPGGSEKEKQWNQYPFFNLSECYSC